MTVPKLLLKSGYDVTTFGNGRSFPTKFLQDSLQDVEKAVEAFRDTGKELGVI